MIFLYLASADLQLSGGRPTRNIAAMLQLCCNYVAAMAPTRKRLRASAYYVLVLRWKQILCTRTYLEALTCTNLECARLYLAALQLCCSYVAAMLQLCCARLYLAAYECE